MGVAALVIELTVADGWISMTAYYAAMSVAVALAWFASWRHADLHAARVFLALGVTVTALADAGYDLNTSLTGNAPDISLADVGWVLSYVFVAAAVIALLRRPGAKQGRDTDAVIDMLLTFVVGGLAVWTIWVAPIVADGRQDLWVRLVTAAYPVLDVALLGLLVRMVLSRPPRVRGAVLVAAGVGSWLASDLAYLVADGVESPWQSAGWMLAAMLLAAGAWTFAARPAPGVPTSVDPPTSRFRVAASLLTFAIPWLFEVRAYFDGETINPMPLLGASVLLAGLTCWRMSHLLEMIRASVRSHASSERRYRALAANTSDAVVVLDATGRLADGGSGLWNLLDRQPAADPFDLLSATERGPEGSRVLRDLFVRSLELPSEVFEGEFSVSQADGSARWLSGRVVNLIADPDVRGVVVTLHDVTDRKRVEHELVHHAFHDTLTGLANRALLLDRLAHALSQGARTGVDPAVLYIDLDGFKAVNDTLGHAAGDEALQEVAARIGATLRTGDTLARMGGDEFIALIEQSPATATDAMTISERVMAALAAPITVAGEQVTLTASIGIAEGSPECSADTLVRDADIAMYQAKFLGKACVVRYEPEMREAAARRFQIDNDLHRALPDGRLRLDYQAVVDLEDGTVRGVEALLRWDHPTLGVIAPGQFVEVAERSGLIVPIGRWVLEQACAQLAVWRRELDLPAGFSVAVNVAATQLTAPKFIDDVTNALDGADVDAGSLVLEITESALVKNTHAVADELERLRRLGVRIAIDDFGTGYSALSYLQHMPIDVLKIDRSFVESIESSTVPDIIRGIVDLARTLGLETIAEGIETVEQRDQLRALRCSRGQGFLFARPSGPAGLAAQFARAADLARDAADVGQSELIATTTLPTA